MALQVEGVVDGGVDAEESLCGAGRFEPLHFPLPSPHNLVRVLGAIVRAQPLLVTAGQTELPERGGRGVQLVGNRALRRKARHCHGNRVGRAAYRVRCRDGSALLPPSSLPARANPTRHLAVSLLHPELPRCRGAAGRTRVGYLLRNGAALGAEIRTGDRATATPASSAAEQSLASRRDGGADRRRADVSVAGRRPRGRGPRHAGSAPTRYPGGAAADAQAAQEARVRAEIAGHRQAALLRRGVPASPAYLSASARAAE